ncbi:MAG: Hpt domain-containing protein [Bacterioplanes sp.]|nr:Hpt domain-containing protein [Bacterioplanes sp.]
MTQDYIALEWVKGEIEETLQQAQQTLEAYVEHPEDKSRLKFCLSYLHQIHGTLQMVEFYGAALLAEEMEAVAKALCDEQLSHERDGLEVLMQAIIQLPHYLEHVKVGRRDLPVVVLPILNELRAARGESFLSESALFTPTMSTHVALTDKQKTTFSGQDFAIWLRKIRQMLQAATLQLLQNKQPAVANQYLNKAFARLHKALTKTPQGDLWLSALAFSEWLAKQDTVPSSAKQLLRQLDHLLKDMLDDPVAALSEPPAVDLIKNLLIYVAHSDVRGDGIQQARQTFGLQQSLPTAAEIEEERSALSAPDKGTIGHVLAALIEEIAVVKDRLDILVRGGEDRMAALSDVSPTVKQIADTLGMLGLGMPRKVMQEQQQLIGRLLEQEHAPDSDLLDIAGALLYVEATLSGMQKEGSFVVRPGSSTLSDAQRAVLREARNVLEEVKESIVAYIGNQWNIDELSDVPRLLHTIEGSLAMIPLPRVAAILVHAAQFVQKQLIDQALQPEWSMLDVLADVLTGVEYYLERYSDQTSADDDELIQRAEEQLKRIPVVVDHTIDSAVHSEPVPVELELTDLPMTNTDDERSLVSSPIDTTQDELEDDISFDGDEQLGSTTVAESLAWEDTHEHDEEVVYAQTEQDEQAAYADNVEPNTMVDAGIEQELPAIADVIDAEDDDLIDDEIIEIFLEEAEEVTATLDEFWPQVKADIADQEALTTVRRAFHTLKGSGRMVKANVIGELAWSIENMFNRVLDQTITIDEPLMAIVDHVITQLPTLIDDFRTQRANTLPTDDWMAYAHALSAGQTVDPNLFTLGDTASDDDSDDGLIDVFIGEAETHLAVLADFIQQSEDDAFSNGLSDHIQRALHTLKGSAHMADIAAIAAVAAPLERLIKELRSYQVHNNPGIVALIRDGMALMAGELEPEKLQQLDHIHGTDEFVARVAQLETLLLEPLIQAHGDGEGRGPNPQAIAQFLANGMDALLLADELLQEWQRSGDDSVVTRLSDDLAEVADGAAQAGIAEIQDLAHALDDFYVRIRQHRTDPNPDLIALAGQAHEALLSMMDCLAAGQEIPAADQMLHEIEHFVLSPISALEDDLYDSREYSENEVDVAQLLESTDAPSSLPEQSLTTQERVDALDELPGLIDVEEEADDEILEIFLEEAQEISESVQTALENWQDNPDNLLEVAQLQRELHTLKGGARMANLNPIADLCHELETLYEYVNDGRLEVSAELFGLLQQAHDELNTQLDSVRAGGQPHDASIMSRTIKRFARGEDTSLPIHDECDDVTEYAAEKTSLDLASAQTEPTSAAVIQSESLDESDREILEIFIEEAHELQELLDRALHDWEQNPDDQAAPAEAQRVLHTLKGGARLAGLIELGDLAHAFEADILALQTQSALRHGDFVQPLYQQQDLLIQQVDDLQAMLTNDGYVVLGEKTLISDESEPSGATEPSSAASIDDTAKSAVGHEVIVEESAVVAASNVVPLRSNVNAAPDKATKTPSTKANAAKSAATVRKAPQEMVKVSADLLDGLVNLAGETSIGRGRLEQQVTDFAHTLEEMDMTLDRLRDQLRRLDIETEAQVLFRQERHGPSYEEFDPLEMDRYSAMQQLSRALVESASDLIDLKETLSNKTRDTETLLLQQSRVNTELQEGLMKTRMVPFQRLVPRLRRIVRQVSLELDKQVELNVINADGEMDRTILERLISPLEHMVRNSVDHGIESLELRQQQGKPAAGSIELEISRDGGDVVLTLRDDGRGVNIEAVKRKAIERGLMEADAQLSDQEMMQFILQAGFSTAETVTQISGRGVGMDVVSSEIKQMGGSIEIHSQAGQGSVFTIRLPFTVSVNRALMVRVGDDLYAIPLNNIQGIVRAPVAQLQNLYQQSSDQRRFEYAGQDYRLEYLGVMLDNETQPKIVAQALPLPLLLIRGAVPFALQVDSLLGSREIVVKTLGPQFAGVMGVSGGTILGDGNVVIILDLPAMIRTQASLEYQQAKQLDHQEAERRHELEKRLPRILVVDDSVTVRKVTTRLLERNGMEVYTAKDGVDAMATLQDHKPDLMLLDIEMPRMDGFEVASQVRHDSRLKDIPIIMITSRTGDKHRERAMAIGVNEYMGKPFQEDGLLSTMNRLLGREDY